MGLFTKNKKEERLIKFFKDKNLSIIEHDNLFEITLNFVNNKYYLHPYFKFDDDILNISINLRKYNKKENIYEKINSFNLLSKYFKAVIKDDLIILTYNTYYSGDNEQILDILNSLYSLENEIDNL